MAPITKPSGLSPLIPVPWAGVRAWLDEAEATQAATGGATMHLTHAQLLALSQLASFCAAEPALPKEDHVSKLMRMSSSPSSVLAAAATGTGVAIIQDDYPGAAAVDTAAATPVAAAEEEEEEEKEEEADGADAADPMEGVVRFANGPELTQARHLEPPIFTMSDPVDVPFRGAFQLRWHCVCVLPWCGKSFPAREEGRAPALFSNKKDAKQYAAMLALAYLNNATRELTMSHTPRETPRKVETPKPSTQQALPKLQQQQQQAPPSQAVPSQAPPSQPDQPEQQPPASPSKPPALPVPAREAASPPNRLKRPLGPSTTSEPDESSPPKQRHRSRSSSPLQPPATPPAAAVEPSPAPPSASASACACACASTPARTPTLAPEPAPFVSPKGRGADAAAEQKQLFDEIHRLCARLGVSQPTYRLTQDPDRPSFFSGHAEFSAGSRVPDGIAVVRDVLGKRQTRIQIAQQILKWMEEEEARRKQRVDAMLS